MASAKDAKRLFLLFLAPLFVCAAPSCSVSNPSTRFDCLPGPGLSQSACEARGCCWLATKQENKIELQGVPTCYFPKDYQGYNLTTIKETDYGLSAVLQRSTSSGWPNDIKSLVLDIWFETSQRLHFKIYDPMIARYEVPIETPPVSRQKPQTTDYDVAVNSVGLIVTRKSTGAVLFDSTVAPLVFADQFLQISTSLTSEFLYGLGEHKSTLLHNASNWQRVALWAKDQAPDFNTNLYGSHPFYLNIEKDGQTHGVFLLNSNAMDIDIQPMPAVTFRTIGGVLDLYIFTGPSSSNVVKQYTSVIGRPQLPPYWSLGFHLCRYNYNSIQKLKLIIDRNRKIGIPYDVQWNDIDYMDRKLDWTYDQTAYIGLPDVIKDLHDYGQHYVIIVDPGISNQYPSKYKPYDVGLMMNVFVKNVTGDPLIGKVWPGSTVFPDFTNPNTTEWWYNVASEFHSVIQFDGLWTDMNEPSDFVSGSLTGCTANNLDAPPYVPSITGNGKLEYNTICPSAKQYLSSHYNLHNMYGLTEVNATNSALHKILRKRSIVISRSSYPSLGRFGGHWSGDISSTWEDLYYSIPAILEFQFYGIPLVGADICGFRHDTTEELCTRWMQLGAFYPFMRNHNDDTSIDQDPGAFSVPAQRIMKSVLQLRYSLLPFMYTQFFFSHVNGSGVIEPLFFRYPKDIVTYAIDAQFLWGSALLISPALKQGQVEVQAYFPSDLWYDIYDGSLTSGLRAQWLTLKAPIEKINVHVRGGSIVPMQRPAITTTIARTTPFGLLVAFDANSESYGSLYWDDGESLDSVEHQKFSYVHFDAMKGIVTSHVHYTGYNPPGGLILDTVRCLGVSNKPNTVTVDGQHVDFHYHDDVQELLVTSLKVDLLKVFKLEWH